MTTPFTGPIPTPTVPAPDIVRCAYLELVVTDLEKSRAFYVDLLGLHVNRDDRPAQQSGRNGNPPGGQDQRQYDTREHGGNKPRRIPST